MSGIRAVRVALLLVFFSAFWKGSHGCSVNISVTGYPLITVSEQQSYVPITLTRVNKTSEVNVMAYPQAVTVTNGTDVILSNISLTFAAGQASVSTNITILFDQFLEHSETFYFQLKTTDLGVCFLNNNITVKITNDDKVTVGFSSAFIYVREDDAHVPFKFTLTGHSAIPVTIGYMTTGVGNATNNSDYNSTNVASLYTFPSGANSGSKNVSGLLKDDTVVEDTECFQVKLTTAMVDVTLSPDNAMVCVTNDDTVEFNFLYSNMTVEEDKGSISIPVNKTGRSTASVNFKLRINEESYSTATRGDDYQDIHGNIIAFPASDQELSTMYVNVSIKMDGKAESSEVFDIGLEAVESSGTIGIKKSMVVKITDKKDNDDYEARERQREEDDKRRTDNLLLILYLSVAFLVVILIILIIICVLVIRKVKKMKEAN